MRETTRRTICRVTFVLLCVVPTFLVLAAIGYCHSSLFANQQQAAWQRKILLETGLLAAVSEVSYPRGGVTLLHRVVLSDPDTRREVLRVRLVEMGQTDQGFVVLLSQPEISDGQLLRLWETFQERILRGVLPRTALHLRASEATILERSRPLTLTDVAWSLLPGPQNLQSTIQFRVAGLNMQQPAELQIARDRRSPTPSTRWELRTGDTPLPSALLARYCPPLSRLGLRCRFRGVACAELGTNGIQGQITGLFHDVDLERLIEPFPHKLSGLATLKLDEVQFTGGRLTHATGTLDCRGGVISRSLLVEVARAFGAEIAPRKSPEEQPLLEYVSLAIGFQLERQGLRIFGLCDQEIAGVLLMDEQGPLLVDSQSDPVPPMILAQALGPDSSLQVPATEEMQFLLQTLPLPPGGTSIQRTAENPAYAPVRLQPQR